MTATVMPGAGDKIMVSGNLDVHTVSKCRDDGLEYMPASGGRVHFDLSDTDATGSAVIALLIAWQREAKVRQTEMSIVGATDQLLAIAEACGVRDILPFTG